MGIFSRLELLLVPYVWEFFRLLVWLILLVVIFVPLERIFAIHPQKVFRKAFFSDVAYYFISSLLPKVLLIVPVAILGWALNFVVPEVVHQTAAGLPFCGRLAAALVVGEIGFYWGHRWTHEIPFLWRFHAIHHSAEEMDWLVNTRAHPLDMVFTRLCGFVPMYVLGLAQPVERTLDLVPLLVLLIGTVWGFFVHANLRWRFGPLEWLIATPAFHHWHHTRTEQVNKNYSSMLPWLDRLFGTYYVPKELPASYGIDQPMADDLTGQMLQPLLPPRQSTA